MAAPRKHPLHDSISSLRIRSVAVVDDALDPVSLLAFQEGEVGEFIDEANDSDECVKEFHQVISGKVSNAFLKSADVTDDAVKVLWAQREGLALLGPVLKRTLFRVLEGKASQVEALSAILRHELKVELVREFGTQSAFPEESFDIAFIDYRFGPSREESSVKRAEEWATHLYRKGKSFIVLMSAELEAYEKKDAFREASKLSRGLFEFLNKAEITDRGKFYNRVNSFCAGLDTRHKIHQFTSAAEAAIDEAVKTLKQSIHALGLEDFAYLEQISLREDGHPLGDYMLWLFGEHFAHELAVDGSLTPVRNEVNKLKYGRFLPLQRRPSMMLARMYSSAITEPVYEGWDPHPREVRENDNETPAPASSEVSDEQQSSVSSPTPEAPSGEPQTPAPAPEPATADSAPAPVKAPVKGLPLYQLGDLLVADRTKPIYLVLNAGCDLQFSPGNERECDIDQSILLVPGRFEPLHEHGEETNVKRTELFELGEERFRIVWQHKRVRTISHRQVRSELEPLGYQRTSRLKMAYALEIQQHFAAQLTRVGVPTPTPVFRERPVQVYGKDSDGQYVPIAAVSAGVIIFHHRDEDQFILTVDCVHELCDYIDRFATGVDLELAEDEGESADAQKSERRKRQERRRKYLQNLRSLREDLSHGCKFQDVLHKVPIVGSMLTQTDADNQVQLEVHHARALRGRPKGSAVIFLAFSLADEPLPSSAAPERPATVAPEASENVTEDKNP